MSACGHDERLLLDGECKRCADDAEMRRAGFHGYDECPKSDCPRPYLCSEAGDCLILVPRWPR